MPVRSKILISGLVAITLINIIYYRQHFIEFWIKFGLYKQPIVITLTTTPHRIAEIKYTLDSLQHQKLQAPIYLSIPYWFKRDNIAYEIPGWLYDYPNLHILRTEDYGPATKVLGLLEQVELEPETIIISVDDDVMYPNNLVLQLAHYMQQNPNIAAGFAGSNIDYDAPWHLADRTYSGLIDVLTADAAVDVLNGYAAIAYRKENLQTDLFQLVANAKPCNNADDLIFSFYLAAQNIPRKVLKNSFISLQHIRWQTDMGQDPSALHVQIPKPIDKHKACLAYFHELDPQVKF